VKQEINKDLGYVLVKGKRVHGFDQNMPTATKKEIESDKQKYKKRKRFFGFF